MKTFKQYLSEAERLTVKQVLERDCAPFLKESKQNGLIYRGIKGLNPEDADNVAREANSVPVDDLLYWTKTVRTDRKPKDTHPSMHAMINDWFKKKFGFGARSETMFCLGEKGIKNLRQYGTPCIVFPIGEFQYVWSPTVTDLYNEVGKLILLQDEGELIDYLDECNYIDHELNVAVRRNNGPEIMIKCSRYYAFEMHDEHWIKLALDMTP